MTAAAQALVEIDPSRVPTRQEPAIPLAEMTPVQMAYQLIQSGADFNSVKEMLALSKELAAMQSRQAFEEAVAAAKAEIQPVHRNAEGHNKKRYADFAAYAKAVDPIITKYGLSYRFRTTQTDKITVTCILAHKAGHFEENDLSGPADTTGSKNAVQAIGSTLTYLQRYSLIQALGLSAATDDDGKAASESGPVSQEQVKAILARIEEVGAATPKFCEIYQIESVPELPSKLFDDAMENLRAYGLRNKK
jgi:hypothetical protein